MTLRNKVDDEYVSVTDAANPPLLPPYSLVHQQGELAVENAREPQSPAQPIYMTAEQEKTYLDGQERLQTDWTNRSGKESGEQQRQHTTTPSTFPPTPSDGNPSEGNVSAIRSSRGLQVPSCHRRVSSGFPYPDLLNTHNISAEQWNSFTSEVTQAAQLTSKDWSITIGAGLATFCATGMLISWLGIVPAWFVSHRLRLSTEMKNVRQAKVTGDLEARLLRWNQNTFAPKGLLIRLDLPGDEVGDVDQLDVYTNQKRGGKFCGAGRRFNRGKWAAKRAECVKRKSASRGRIVIIPLNGSAPQPIGLTEKHGMTAQVSPPLSEKGPAVCEV